MALIRGHRSPRSTLARSKQDPFFLLKPHGPAPCTIRAHIAPDLSLRFILSGDLRNVRIPAPAYPIRTEELWRHTCFELFLQTPTGRYAEFNLSPSAAWAAYRFEAYRAGMSDLSLPRAPHIAVAQGENRLLLDVTLDLGAIAQGLGARPDRAGLAAVVEAADGTLSYFALAHPPGAPNFHHRDCFALQLAAAKTP